MKVLLASITGIDSLFFDGTFIMETEEATYEFGKNNKRIFIEKMPNAIKIFNENRLFKFQVTDKIHFLPENESATFNYGQNAFKGRLTVSAEDSASVFLINELDVESYLKGVVPAEIFTNDLALGEAVKAQAVCARSYALDKMKSNKNEPFHLYGSVKDQAYGGFGIQTRLGNAAVDETKGSVLMYGKDMVSTYYHASCGGVLEDPENVWSGTGKIYLKSGQDVVGNKFADMDSPYYRWTEERTIQQLDSSFAYNFNLSYLDDVVKDTMDIPLTVMVSERYPSGRAKNVSVQYGTERKELKNYEIRKFFGWPPGKLLKSTLFTFSATDSSLIIKGAGNGHGVGLCQYGSMYKSKKGLKYYHILQSYFPGTTLEKRY